MDGKLFRAARSFQLANRFKWQPGLRPLLLILLVSLFSFFAWGVLSRLRELNLRLYAETSLLLLAMAGVSSFATVLIFMRPNRLIRMLQSKHVLRSHEQQKQADLREQKLQQNLEEAQILAQSGSWEFEVDTKQFFWSKNLYRLYGRDPSIKMTGPVYWTHYSAEQKTLILSKIDEAIQGLGEYAIELEVQRADGELRIFVETARTVFNDAGKAIRMFGLTRDVTESRRAKEHLRTVQEKMKKLFDNTSDILFLLSVEPPLRFRFVEVNPSFLTATGLNKEQIIGKYLEEIIPIESHEFVLSHYAELLKTLKPVTWEEVTRYPAGEKTGVVRICPVLNSRGNCEFIVGNVHDITEQKESEKLMLAQRETLVMAAKMSALGEMAAGIAHEINNPLAIIAGYATIIRRHVDSESIDQARLHYEIEKIESTVDRIVKIIRGLRLISRNADDDPSEIVCMTRVICDTLELCRERFSFHKVAILTEFDPTEENLILGRAAQLSQVLLNLLSNAFDAVEACDKAWVRIEIAKNPSFIRVAVTDSGLGIADNLLDKITQPFFTTKEVGRGTGLGLSISLGIVESHGGKLWYDRTSANTRFIIELPRACSPKTSA